MITKANALGSLSIRERVIALILIVSLAIILIILANVFINSFPNLTAYQKSRAMEIFSNSAGLFLGVILMIRGFLELRSNRKIQWHLLVLGVFLVVGNVWLVSTLLPVVFGRN